MSLTVIKGLQSEIFVPITPTPVWAPVTKELKDMTIALVTAAGVHLRTDKKFNLAGDFSFREVPGNVKAEDMMVTHGGYDNGDVNKDINAMFPLIRLQELAEEGFIKAVAPAHFGFMGGGDQEKLHDETGPQIAAKLNEEGVDAVLMTAG